MRITVLATAADVGFELASRIAGTIALEPQAVIGLPTGNTPVQAYRELQRRHAAGEVDFASAATFNLDEFVGIPASHPGSFRRFMERHLFAGVNLHPSRIHFLDGAAADLAAECQRYEAAIAAAGGIDLQVLGIGANGHVGFNEPGEWLVARTHVATLLPSTRRDNAALFDGDARAVPERALTMGMGTILRARRVVLVATGAGKAQCIHDVVHGGVTTQLPASLLQLHGDVELLLDRDAGVRLKPDTTLARGG